MKIINQSPETIEYKLFDASDSIASTPHAIARLSGGFGRLVSAESRDVSASGGVQIKIFTELNTPLGLFQVRAPFINASKDRIFGDSDSAVFTGSQLVKLDNDYNKLIGLNPSSSASSSKSGVDVNKIVRAILTLAEAFVNTAWGEGEKGKEQLGLKINKWAPASAFKIALALVDIFGQSSSSNTGLSLLDIQSTVQNITDQNEARLGVGDVFSVADWLDKYVEKSRHLALGGKDLTTFDLSDYDRAQFLKELDAIHMGTTAFKKTMAMYKMHRDIRKHAMPTYLLGLLLDLHIEVLCLVAKSQSAPLDSADTNAVTKLVKGYRATLPELQEDYVTFCNGLYNKYPLLTPLYYIGRTDVTLILPAPAPQEGIALGTAAGLKWLGGDPMVIDKTMAKLNTFIGDTH